MFLYLLYRIYFCEKISFVDTKGKTDNNTCYLSFPEVLTLHYIDNERNMIRRPRRSSVGADLPENRDHPLYNNAALIPQTANGSYPCNIDTMTQRNIRRKKQRRHTSLLQRFHSCYLPCGEAWRLALITIISLVWLCFWISRLTLHQMTTTTQSKLPKTPKMRATISHRVLTNSLNVTILFPSILAENVKRMFAMPNTVLSSVNKRPDFGGIELRIAEDTRFRSKERIIYHDYHANEGYNEMLLAEQQDDDEVIESYYAFDDDAKRNPYVEYDDPDIHSRKQCRRTSWHRDLPIMCNLLHEFDFPNNVGIGHTRFLRFVRCPVQCCFISNAFILTLTYCISLSIVLEHIGKCI